MTHDVAGSTQVAGFRGRDLFRVSGQVRVGLRRIDTARSLYCTASAR